MPVILGNASRPSFDAAGAMLQNKQIETQKAIALAQIKAANARAAMGMAQSALGMLNANSERAKDRQMAEAQRAQQMRAAQQNAQIARGNKLAQDVARENEKWRQFRNQWKLKGFEHSQEQMFGKNGLQQIEDELRDLTTKYNAFAKSGDNEAADATLMKMLDVQQKRWMHQPETRIFEQFQKDAQGREFIANPDGTFKEWKDTGISDAERLRKENMDYATKKRAQDLAFKKEARDLFRDAYESGSTYNDAVREMDDFLIESGLPPSGKAMKRPEDPGYYYRDPKVDAAAAKTEKADAKWLAGERFKIQQSIANRYLEKNDKEMPPAELEKATQEAWDKSPYKALEVQMQSERQSRAGQQPQQAVSQQAADSGIPPDVTAAEAWLQKAEEYVRSNAGRLSPTQIQTIAKQREEAKKTINDYRQSQGMAPVGQEQPAAPAQAQPAAQQPAPQQAPQAEAPAAPAKPQGPFKGRIISSMGGGGMGGTLAMGGMGLTEMGMDAWDSMTTKPDAPLATGPDAQSVSGGDKLDRLDGFRQRMEAWIKRNPMPSESLYQDIRDGNSRDYTTGSVFKPTPKGRSSSSAGPGAAVPSVSGGPSVPAPKLAPFTATPKGPMGPMGPLGTLERSPLGPELSKPYGGSGYAPSGAKEAASTAGKLGRAAGNLGTAATVAGWIGSLMQEPSKHINPEMVNWMTQRMSVENAQADAFGIPRAEARKLSNSLDGYAKGVKPDHLSEMRSKADKIVPPPKTPESKGWKHDPPLSEKLPNDREYRTAGGQTKLRDIDKRYNESQAIHRFDGDDHWVKWKTTPGVDFSGRWERVPDAEVEAIKKNGLNGIKYAPEAFDTSERGVGGTSLTPVKPEGYRGRPETDTGNGLNMLPGSKMGARSYSEPFLEEIGPTPKEAARLEAERDAVTFYEMSGNSKPPIPDGANSDDVKAQAFQKTGELNQALRELEGAQMLPFNVLEKTDNYPEWVKELPAASWKDEKGKTHQRNGIGTSPAEIKRLVNEIAESQNTPEWKAAKAAEAAAKQEAEQAKFQPRPLPEQIGPDHGVHLSPQAQESHLRSPKPATPEQFKQAAREIGLNATDEDYQNYIDARAAVRSRLPTSASETAPGNLFLDPKTGELKQNDGGKGRTVPDSEPLPRGYDQTIPVPKSNLGDQREQPRQPQARQIQGGLNAEQIRQGAAAARRNQAFEDANSPAQRALDQLNQRQQQEARGFGQPRGQAVDPRRQAAEQRLRQEQQRLDDLKRQAEGMRDGINDRVKQIQNNRVFPFPPNVSQNQYQPTFQDFSSQGQFPQSLNLGQRQLPDYSNALSMNSLGNTFWPQETPNYLPQQSYQQPQYDQQPLSYYEPQYSQPQFDYMPQTFDFQPSYQPVGSSFQFDYSQPQFVPYFDPQYSYPVESGYYGAGDYGSNLGDYSSYV